METAVKIIEWLVAFLSIFTIMIFFSVNNPLSICLALIGLALFTGILTWLVCAKWLGLAVILVFVGGIIISFLYISGLALNQKMVISFQTTALSLILSRVILTSTALASSTKLASSSLTSYNELMFSMENRKTVFLLIIFLLVVIVAVVKLVESFKGSLVQRF